MTAPFEQMMRWTYHWHPPIFGLRAATREVDSRLADILWYAILAALGLYGALRIYAFAHANLSLERSGHGRGAGLHHHAAGDGADRAGQPDLDADRHLCRPAAPR